ncbi:type IV pilin protein [Ramlibacter sp. H39-3-26]|uniref:type IV pilin protein n=1 Tax=Curvibacter soli TaxID=3031331 RepID=UPI0023DA8A74|nr:type IV pilin protein [Ramlibacter sp. H39-3-26]MDF1483650.1 type IV pilin protein [Ramlibacter sp. H39-3-26]
MQSPMRSGGVYGGAGARGCRGFTLIELMITVAIVGILAAIAYPSYNEQIAKGRRADMRTVLMAGQQWMERFYTENYRYDQNSAGTAVTDATQFAGRFSKSPTDGAALYNIAVTAGATTYTIKATRATGTVMASDKCGDYSIDNLGRKKLENYASSFADEAAAREYCWK